MAAIACIVLFSGAGKNNGVLVGILVAATAIVVKLSRSKRENR